MRTQKFEAVVFDIGRTLVGYQKPLNWAALYRPALEHVSQGGGYGLTEEEYQHAICILKKYNTRINPREHEITSQQLFIELLEGTRIPMNDLPEVKHSFYSFFRRDAIVYPEVPTLLATLAQKGIVLATLSDVAYGMDNHYVLDDISSFRTYIHYPWTSNDVGYRKPSVKGLQRLAFEMNIELPQIVFVGDEEKDMICANQSGAFSVLINRDEQEKLYGQKETIRSLNELLKLFE